MMGLFGQKGAPTNTGTCGGGGISSEPLHVTLISPNLSSELCPGRSSRELCEIQCHHHVPTPAGLLMANQTSFSTWVVITTTAELGTR